MRQLNKIERMFLEAIREYYDLEGTETDSERLEWEYGIVKIAAQYPIDLNIVDFYIEKDLPDGNCSKFVVEIDGHEYHKTKEQRYHDYVRERKLQKNGYYIVRFMASEVYVNARKCIEELDEIMSEYHSQGLSLLAK